MEGANTCSEFVSMPSNFEQANAETQGGDEHPTRL